MDKNAIKKYAVWARRELISRVSQKALQYGITEENTVPANATTVNGVILSNDEMKQRRALIERIADKGYQQVMEEVAYTWFNRFIALRFMEVNGYLPSHVRVFTDDENNFKPQILKEAINLDFEGLDMDKVYEMKDANDNEALFKYLLIIQCNALNPIMPRMFQKISDYTELLFPDNLLREGSAVQQMIELIPEEDWKDAVQIIGWMYQYYNSEKKDEVFAALKKNVKITKENIPAATQLFTPDWIVRYMVENSLGRLWLEGHPNDELKAEWKYYLSEEEQTSEIQTMMANIRDKHSSLAPEEIKCIDPCAGSGHILVYMFDVLMHIYEIYGYTPREAVSSIIENNLYGLDIDERAAQLAYFAVMMKARQYDRRFFMRRNEEGESEVLQPHIYSITESNTINSNVLKYFGCSMTEAERKKAFAEVKELLDEMVDAKEFGSILSIRPYDWKLIFRFVNNIDYEGQLDLEAGNLELTRFKLLRIIKIAQIIEQKYHVVVTNPPYMGASSMGEKLAEVVKKKFPNSKTDMFSVFTERCAKYTLEHGYYALITQPSLLSLASFQNLRTYIIENHLIESLLYMGRGIFGIDFGSMAFVVRNSKADHYRGRYFRLHKKIFQYLSPEDIEKLFLFSKSNKDAHYDFEKYDTEVGIRENDILVGNGIKLHHCTEQQQFLKIDGSPFAFWFNQRIFSMFEGNSLADVAKPRQGLATGDNDRFLRLWHEVSLNNIGFGCASREDAQRSCKKWFPCNKGGTYRKWYGNNDYIVNWENDGNDIRNNFDEKGKLRSRPQNIAYYFREGMTWSTISCGDLAMRYSPVGHMFETKGSVCFPNKPDDLMYLLGLMNTPIIATVLTVLSPTLDFHEGPLGKVPVVIDLEKKSNIIKTVKECVGLSKEDWDSNETSWDFIRHPLVSIISKEGKWLGPNNIHLSECYNLLRKDYDERFSLLKKNEEEINRLFIEIYGLQDELIPEVEEKNITVSLTDVKREVKSFISYAVGCMFGRYSLDVEGLVFAGGEWDDSKYMTFKADKDSIIPISDDEYFEDDIVGRFVKFIEVVYGKQSLEDNLQFIAEALGGLGQPRDVIRKYFMNDFYADHCKMYQKRPIYWLFDSGKKNGFKALVYMHRYQLDTIARMRTDYVHEQQSRYRTAIADLEQRIASAATSERVKLNKKLKTLKDQAAEIQVYEEKIHHLADQYISIDLDDGVKVNYEKFQDVLAKIK